MAVRRVGDEELSARIARRRAEKPQPVNDAPTTRETRPQGARAINPTVELGVNTSLQGKKCEGLLVSRTGSSFNVRVKGPVPAGYSDAERAAGTASAAALRDDRPRRNDPEPGEHVVDLELDKTAAPGVVYNARCDTVNERQDGLPPISTATLRQLLNEVAAYAGVSILLEAETDRRLRIAKERK